MQWKKIKIVINGYEAPGFRILERPEEESAPFHLELLLDPDAPIQTFSTLKEAQGAASLINEVELLREQNERLQAELNNLRAGDSFVKTLQRANANKAAEAETPKPVPVEKPSEKPVEKPVEVETPIAEDESRVCKLCTEPMDGEAGDVHENCAAMEAAFSDGPSKVGEEEPDPWFSSDMRGIPPRAKQPA
jgi:hypothetical protein